MLPHLQPWEWAVAALASLLVGVSKTGIPGLGIFAVALFALLLPARQSSGVVLPLLLAADVFAVQAYRRHAQWSHLLRLFPWAAVGIGLGWLAMNRINNAQTGRLIGGLLLAMVAVHLWRRRTATADGAIPDHPLFIAAIGILGGFATMVANAAGPIMILYLLAMGLPKYEFMGTGAWYFLLVNGFKVPLYANLGLITSSSLRLDLPLAAFSVGGALYGKRIIAHLNERLFEDLALALTVLAAVKLLF